MKTRIGARTGQLLSDFSDPSEGDDPQSKVILWAKPLNDLFMRSGRVDDLTRLARRGLVIVLAALTILLWSSVPPVLCLVPLVFWMSAEYAVLRYQIAARFKEFDRDFPVLLTALSSAVRTGMDLRAAIKGGEQYFPPTSVIAGDLRSLVQAWDRGEDDEAAFANFGKSIQHPDVPLFLAAVRLALSHGTSFAETLHRLAKVCRQRQSFRRKVRSALAMQRMSSVGILICALCITGFQFMTGRSAVVAAYQHPTGRIFLMLGVGLIVSGAFWMSRIGLRKV